MSTIVLNRMFVGDYCLENIGHEIINIFRADNGHYYVYLNSTGDFAADKKGKVEYVLLTRNCSTLNTVQIIGKAKVIKEIYDPINTKDQKTDPLVKNICYGKSSIVDLFNVNTKDQNIYVTYEVDEIVETAGNLYLSFDIPGANPAKNTLYVNKGLTESNAVKMARASLKQYISVEENSSAYHVLFDAIKTAENWKKEPVGVVQQGESTYKKDNFFKICRIHNDELAYSNAFAYLANKYRKQFCRFAKDVLGITIAEDFDIKREKWNIDILVTDNNSVVVIENKVLSHINGLWFDRAADHESSQLEKYWKIVTCREEKYNKPNKDGHREYEGMDSYFFIVAPDHNNIDLTKYTMGEIYKKIVFSQIRDFIQSCNSNDPFVEQLLMAMEPHCQSSYDYYSEMKTAFLEQCSKVRNLQ